MHAGAAAHTPGQRRPEAAAENPAGQESSAGSPPSQASPGRCSKCCSSPPGRGGKGFGRQLVNYVTRHCGVRRVDVNEQNPQAAGFYERMGFRTAGRDAADPSGRPYPILHMELGHAPHTGLVKIPSLPTDRIGIGIGFRAEVPGTDTEKQP